MLFDRCLPFDLPAGWNGRRGKMLDWLDLGLLLGVVILWWQVTWIWG